MLHRICSLPSRWLRCRYRPLAPKSWITRKYPNFRGQWERFIVGGLGGQPSFDQTKSWGAGQGAPLTPEYKAIFDASLADQGRRARWF